MKNWLNNYYLFLQQAKLEATDRHGQTPLNLAARHGYTDVVKVLLAAGASADHADCDGWTALRAAAWGGHTQVHSQPTILPSNSTVVSVFYFLFCPHSSPSSPSFSIFLLRFSFCFFFSTANFICFSFYLHTLKNKTKKGILIQKG